MRASVCVAAVLRRASSLAVAPTRAMRQEAEGAASAFADSASCYAVQDTSEINIPELQKSIVLTDTSEDMKGRRGVIYMSGQHALTSGTQNSKHWAIRISPTDKWSMQLMGWSAGTDTLSTPFHNQKFDTVQSAVAFCERIGLAWEVTEPRDKVPIAVDGAALGNQYSYNFLSLEVLANLKRHGARRGRANFAHPDSPATVQKRGEKQNVSSTWVNWRKTDFGPDVWRPRREIGQGQTAWAGTGPGAAKGEGSWPAARPIGGSAH
jgi:hypothetical protein